jgi:phosphopantetheine adenylyltransferase
MKVLRNQQKKFYIMQKIHVEGDPKLKNSSGKQYSMFIGRWQPWHSGHRWLIDQRLNQGKNVLICIRDIAPDEKNPFTAQQVYENILFKLSDLIIEERIKVQVIPDIESVNFGRGVGYDIIEHIPPQEVSEISATKIREQLKQEGKL